MTSTLPAIGKHAIGLIKLDVSSLIIFVVATLVFYTIANVVYNLWFHPLSNVPGPAHLAAIDFIYQWRSNISGVLPREASQLHKKYGPMVRIGPNRVSVDGSIGYPEVYSLKAKSLNGTFDKVHDYVGPGSHKTLIGASDELHRVLRRALSHAFSEVAVREQESIISKQYDILMEQLTSRAKVGEVVDWIDWMNFTFFDVIGELTFARTFDSLKNATSHAFTRNFFSGIRGVSYLRLLTSYPTISIFLKLILGREEVNKALGLYQENSMIAAEMTKSRLELGEEPVQGQRDFMTHLLKTNREGEQSMSNENIMLNTLLLVGAGSETTASAMSYFMYICSLNADRKQILVDEILSTFEDESSINMTSCAQISYLQACIDETLRMFSPAAETPPRVSPGAEVGGKFIPKGAIIHVYPWATFRNPENFTDPDSFRPERWLLPTNPRYDARYANDNKACCKPFSFGPRDCLGKILAYNELRLLICRLLFRFDYELLPGQETWHNSQRAFVIWEKMPLKVRFSLRKH